MIKNTLTLWCARGLLALVSLGLAASAQASAIYNFTFTSVLTGNVLATGSFTTGHANPVVAGYEMIDSMTVNTIVDSTNRTWGPFTSISLPAEPSYNPTTQMFTNFDATGTQPGLGDVIFANSPGGANLVLDTTSFTISKHYFAAFLSDRSGSFPFPPPVVVQANVGTANLVISAAAVPEPTSLVLLGTGLLGAVINRRRARAS